MTLRIERLRAGDRIDPLGADERQPVFSWTIRATARAERQVACEVQVAGDRDFATVAWSSGERAIERPWLRYDGVPFGSRTAVFWRIRAKGIAEQWSAWSEPASYETGLDVGDWSASWITHAEWAGVSDPNALPLLAAEFEVAQPIRSARLYVAGLGVYVAGLNGQAVTDAVLEPPYSDYARTVDYSTYDVGHLVRQGLNVLGLRLGTGIAHVTAPADRYTKFAATIARPRALAQLEIVADDGSIQRVVTDETWRATLGPTLRSHWYGGEVFDARRADPDWDSPAGDRSSWSSAVVVPCEVRLAARAAPPIRVVEAVSAAAISEPDEGVTVVDLGVNLAGWPLLQLNTEAGHEITIIPGEILDARGRVDQREIGTPVASSYTTTGGEQSWHPEFMYHGFRYLEVHGLPAGSGPTACTGLALRADNEKTGEFSCSDPLLNGIHRIIDRAVQSNMFSVLTDCPHREKLGWLEETHLLFSVVSHGYDVRAYYRDLVRRMAESQLDNGMVPDISPEYVVFDGGFRDDPNWGGAIIQVPWQQYRVYGDSQTLATYYPAMRRYLHYLRSRAHEGLLDHGLGDWYTLEDPPPRAAVASWGFQRAADRLAQIANVIGKPDEADDHRRLATQIRTAFHERFFDGTDSYGAGQAINALALDMDAVPAALRSRVAARLAHTISEAGDHLMVGEVTLPAVLRALSAGGYDELIYRVASRTDWPSYGYQVKHGATALTEAWDGPTTGASQNHFMLGAIDDWFVRRLAGIDQADHSVGYRNVVIRPALVGDLTAASASILTPYGRLTSSWTRDDRGVRLEVEIPVGVEARIELPGPFGSREVGSGRWSFHAA
ncbi:family 78 glycoside hydrolase catalytic domain [Kribbella sp. NPDC005582]|uniref:family 78 glycoside hydrolase catalytic domain n=1 Tax=Kribbella sp. NPDC005582 TaxID=3156893 RepID=UPI0033B56FDF